MAFFILVNGKTMEMNSISRAIKKKDRGFDINMFKVIHICSTNSPPSYKSLIYKLECSKNLAIMMELYDINFFNPVNPIKIVKKLELEED